MIDVIGVNAAPLQTLTQSCGRELDATERHQPPTGSSVSDPSLFEVVSFRMHINYAMEDHGLHAMSRRPAYEASYGVLTLAVSRDYGICELVASGM